MKVNELMTTAVKTCAPDTNLSEVTALMWTHDCGVIPVVNDRGEVQGLVTDRDICIALGTTGTAAPSLTARDVMSREVVGCAPEDTCRTRSRSCSSGGCAVCPCSGSAACCWGWCR